MAISAQSGVLYTLLDAVTTGTSAALAVPPQFNKQTVLVVGAADVSAGKVKVEGAHAPDYAGTWALIGSEITVGNATVQAVTFTTLYPFIRARVSTDVVGATATVYYIGAK